MPAPSKKVNPNEAPDGYVAIRFTSCGSCAMRQPGNRNGCIRPKCMVQSRTDRCAVMFKKKRNAATKRAFWCTKAYTNLIRGQAVRLHDLTPNELRAASELTRPSVRISVFPDSGFIPHDSRNLAEYANSAHTTWYGCRTNTGRPAKSSEASTSSKGYLVGTADQIGQIVKELERNYPKLRWIGNKSPTAGFASVARNAGNHICFLELGKELRLCSHATTVDFQKHRFALCDAPADVDALIRTAYGAPKPKVVKITVAWLKRENACTDGLNWFVRTFGARASVDPEVVAAALEADHIDWQIWLDYHLRNPENA